LWTATGYEGRGVDAAGVSRAHDNFYDDAFRRENGGLSNAATGSSVLTQLEAGLGEPGENGIGAALDGLFASFTDLANDPAGTTPRTLVRSAAERLIDRLHAADARITALNDDSTARLADQVRQVNSITKQIASLNQQIVAAGPEGAPTLQDQRDQALDQLSSFMSVSVVRHDDGSVGVLTGGALIVDGASARDLVTRASGSGTGVGFALDSGVLDLGSGSMKALSDITTTALPAYRTKLNRLANQLVQQVNAQHRQGHTPGGWTNVDFFDPAGTTAGTIDLSAQVKNSNAMIAAGATSSAGDGDNATALGQLIRAPVVALGGSSLRDFYVDIASGLGAAIDDSKRVQDVQQTLTDNADTQRQQVMGVSVDEEMVQLIAQQQAYGAAARLVNVANEVLDQLLNLVQ
jgi:flagellar hook-associated protein 1 FlgK